MSLINDALKRAKDAQQPGQASAPGPQLRPAEPAQASKDGMSLMVPVVIALVALAGLLVARQFRQKPAARTPRPDSKPLVANPVPEAKPPVEVVAAAASAAPEKPATPVAAPAPPPAAPVAELRLQAIFYSPQHPSAMINGKSVKIGDAVRNFRVARITPTSATLVSATETNVMTLDQ
ncbi:MAG TPA: hypothetical protein VN873_15175 [Candidatus Angelobacter sp.]|nr:hypothetical protein [Candidatus Angelobacter sp.]